MANIYELSSLLMAALFIISTFAQFDDPGLERYGWIIMYGGAAYVNLANTIPAFSSRITIIAGNFAFYHGQFSLSTVLGNGGMGKLLSLDMKEKLVRERIGCMLVIVCMILQASVANEFHQDPAKKAKMEVASATKNGMATLVGISYTVSLVFLMNHHEQMRF